MMTRAELERRLFILRGIVIDQRSAYTDSLWWWLHRRHIKRYDAIVDNIDVLSLAVRTSWWDRKDAFDQLATAEVVAALKQVMDHPSVRSCLRDGDSCPPCPASLWIDLTRAFDAVNELEKRMYTTARLTNIFEGFCE